VFGDPALDQIACYFRLAGAGRCHKEDLGGAGHKLALDLLDGGPLELVQDDAGDIVLMIFGRPGIYFFDRAAKPIYSWSLAGGRTRGASHFRIRRWLPQVRELCLIVFAGQRGCLFPHLRVSYCWIKECRTSLSPGTQCVSPAKSGVVSQHRARSPPGAGRTF
jgi:hypothetical protein